MALDLVVVTGAGRGIGRAVARAMGVAGGPSVLCISRSDACRRTASSIKEAGGSAEALPLDLRELDLVRPAVERSLTRGSYRRVAVVAAAGMLGPTGSFADSDINAWDDVYRVNVLGNLAVIQACVPRMLEAGFGRVVTFAGGGAAYVYPLFPAYAASKTAMVRTTENLHAELGSQGDLTFVCVAPGAVDTDMFASVKASGGEVRTTTDIAEPVRFIAAMLNARAIPFSGCFVHVRDRWPDYIDTGHELPSAEHWTLRRVEDPR